MTYRTKLLALFTLTVAATVSLVAWTTTIMARSAFERVNNERTNALVAQFQREFARRGSEVTRQVEGIATAKETLRLAVAIARPAPDYAALVNEAGILASAYQLDFLELLAEDGTILSSAQWPARFGYKEPWVTETADWSTQGAFLRKEDLPNDSALALTVVRATAVGEKKMYVAGGKKLDSEFLTSLTLPQGMRALLFRNCQADSTEPTLVDSIGTAISASPLLPLITAVCQHPAEQAQTIAWTNDRASAETFHALPLLGQRQEIQGMFLVGSSLAEQVFLVRRIRWLAVISGAMGILLGMILSAWAAARVTRPLERLAGAANDVSEGRWSAHVSIDSQDEVGRVAQAFNRMTDQLTEQRDRLLQAERVAAWRELARRLAHELKNPLFPLQITVENLLRARQTSPDQFEEVFNESTSTLLAELSNLRAIIGRFSDFAKMPAPHLQLVNVNDTVAAAIRVFEAQLTAPGRPPITKQVELAARLQEIQADPELLQRAVQNLILNAIDAMPDGGTLALRTTSFAEGVELEVSDTGTGLTQEECERLFTPYYTTKQHGTGLGLAIVQSVVSDHRGKISVKSDPGKGTTFRILLPLRPPTADVKEGAGERTSELTEKAMGS